MLGYYKIDEEIINKLPSNSKDIEQDLYDLCCPLIIEDDLPKDIKYLYEILEIPILKYEELNTYKPNKEFENYISEFSKYLKYNTEIELLEEERTGHLLRVGRYIMELCKLINIREDEIKDIYIAGLFHDIGKSKLPKKILSKPGKLTEKEFELMKKHSEYGVDILKDFFNENILEIILSHHERCDKSGYPRKIMPNIGAKIVGIADSYDAMLSNRVYKKNKTLKSALEELVRCCLDEKNGGKGILYDEKMVRPFVKYHGYGVLTNNKFKQMIK